MLSTRIRGKIIPTRNELQKSNMHRVMTSQYETGDKNNAHLLSHNLPAREKKNGTSSILAGGKSRMLPPDPLFTHCIMPGSNWNSSDFPSSRLARPPICLSFEYNVQCPLLVTQLFPPLPRLFQLFRLLPYLNILSVQASDISNNFQKAKT